MVPWWALELTTIPQNGEHVQEVMHSIWILLVHRDLIYLQIP